MAQTSAQMPAAARKHAVAASRGSVLALHAAAGMAVSVCREAERLLRASEGLARSAVACLERANRRLDASPGRASGGGGGGTSSAKPEKKNSKKKKASSGKGKGKGKGKDKKDVAMNVEAQDVDAAVAPLRADAVDFIPQGERELADEWADGLVSHGPANLLPVRRRLLQRRSGSRSPRGGQHEQPDPVASSLVAGHMASIKMLSSRPELAGQQIRLVEFDDAADRWRCALRSGEFLRIHQSKLQSVNPGLQRLAEQKFADSAL